MEHVVEFVRPIFATFYLRTHSHSATVGNQIEPEKDLPKRQCKSNQNAPILDSAIGQHLSNNKICAQKFDINWFFILATGQSSVHLERLKSPLIESLKPCSERVHLWNETFSFARK